MSGAQLNRVLLFFAGVVVSLLLVRADISKDMYFDENALLAGLVRTEYKDTASDLSSLATQLEATGRRE